MSISHATAGISSSAKRYSRDTLFGFLNYLINETWLKVKAMLWDPWRLHLVKVEMHDGKIFLCSIICELVAEYGALGMKGNWSY
jgi:hypothetical protein